MIWNWTAQEMQAILTALRSRHRCQRYSLVSFSLPGGGFSLALSRS